VVSDDEPSWAAHEFAIGSQVAGYRLDEQIGRGGMAVVYRAQDPRLDRPVALKILAPDLARDESFRQRFIRESRAAAAVDHPHIIPVFGAGEAAGVLFIAMRYVEGGDVGTLIDQAGPLPVARAVRIIAQVASALDAAHARGLVHRDIKPRNFLLDSSDGADHVYLSDFGLSKQALSSSHLTATGQFLGTLDYVAPEQIESRPVDGRVDLYALACATFEMLSGSPPFKREQRLAVLWAQLSEPPPALTARRPDLPPAVDGVLAKAMAKSPDDRYPRCLDFVAALRDACGLGTGDLGTGDTPRIGTPSPGPAGPVRGDGETVPQAGPPGPGGTEAGLAGVASASLAEPPGDAGPAQPGSPPQLPGDAGPAQPASEPPGPPRPATEAARPAQLPGDAGPAQPDSPARPPDDAGPAQPDSAAQPAGEPAGPPRPATEAARRARPPREIIGPWTAAGAGARGAGTGGGAGAGGGSWTGWGAAAGTDPQGGGREDQATQPGRQTRPGGREPSRSGWPPGPPPLAPLTPSGPPPGRPRWRSPAALVVGCVAVLGLAGGAYAVTRGGGNTGTNTNTAALSPPGCLASNASAPPLGNIRTNLVRVPGQPWAVVTAKGGWSFLTLPSGSGSSIAVMRDGSGLSPSFVRSIAVEGAPRGATITPDGRYLLAGDNAGAVVIDVAQAEQGGPNPIAGSLTSPGGSGGDQVRLTPDGRFAFVTMQSSNTVAVFNLQAAIASGFGSSHFVGTVPLGLGPVGMSVSPDGRWLYATTSNRSKHSEQGGLSVIDVRRAETNPASALKATVSAGCVPIRVITTHSGQYVWVTARDSNMLLAFSSAKLLSDPRRALIARVRVGQGPIGLTPYHNDRIIVADSNLHTRKGATANLGVVDASAALAGKPALLGVIHAGLLPRQFAMEPGSTTLLVTNSTSQQLQAVDIGNLP
jgi:DNA-binding beta-propeller fold protein YncE